jgi:hypothetical protein
MVRPGQKFVGPCFNALNAILNVSQGGDDYDRDMGCFGIVF